MAYNYWIRTVFEELAPADGYSERISPERNKFILQLSKPGNSFYCNGEKIVHSGKHLNLYVRIVKGYKGSEKIREILCSDIFEANKKYRVKKEIKKELHSPLLK